MSDQQLSLFNDFNQLDQFNTFDQPDQEINQANNLLIYLSALSSGLLKNQQSELIRVLANYPESVSIARILGDSRLVRHLNLMKKTDETTLPQLTYKGDLIFVGKEEIGYQQILYKSPLPGELQARLSFESIIYRFLEYLQKLYKIIVIDESDFHVQVFIPKTVKKSSFQIHWQEFLENVAFSIYGDAKNELPGLAQTFISMLNTVTLAGRGFSTLEVPILSKDQANVLAGWYWAVIRDVNNRQTKRQDDINKIQEELNKNEDSLSAKDRKSKIKLLEDKQTMQSKEKTKYDDYFQKSFGKFLEEQGLLSQKLSDVENQLLEKNLTKSQQNKLEKQREQLKTQIFCKQDLLASKKDIFSQYKDPFLFVETYKKLHNEEFNTVDQIARLFNKTATDQINSTRGDIFTQCIKEMYRLLEMTEYDPIPRPLLQEKINLMALRSAGDNTQDFCYACGVGIDQTEAKWKVARFMFERPSQRLQSSSSEDRPRICSTCSSLAFASPLKVTDESIILQLESNKPKEPKKPKDIKVEFNDSKQCESNNQKNIKAKIQEYLRMLTSKQLNFMAGKYVVLTSDKTNKGDSASDKLGQIQYALAKVASIFPGKVLTNFKFSLVSQGTKPIILESRHLIFIQGLIECYEQKIIISGQDINVTLGEAIRYVENDLPCLAEYTIVTKNSSFSANSWQMEKVRSEYWQSFQNDLVNQGENMTNQSDQKLTKAKLYKDVMALTGITFAFAQSLESTAKAGAMKKEDIEREIGKLIEEVDDPVAFCYYATLGDENKTDVQARLFLNNNNTFIYERTKALLKDDLGILDREGKDSEKKQVWLQLYADDVIKAYTYFAENGYSNERDWKNLTYNLKLSLYTRFPELVRKLKSNKE